MEQTMQFVVQNVESKSGVSQRTQKPYTIFTISTSEGAKVKTFDREVAVKLNETRGQLVTAAVEPKPWTSKDGLKSGIDYDLKSVVSLGQSGLAPAPQQTVQAPAPLIQQNPISIPTISIPAASDKDASIARAVALKAAVDHVVGLQQDAGPQQVIALAKAYEPYLLGKEPGNVSNEAQVLAAVAEQFPTAVLEQQASESALLDDGIPFGVPA